MTPIADSMLIKLNERQLRVLQRIGRLMANGESCEILVVLNDGGIRGFKEQRLVNPADLEAADPEFGALMRGLISQGRDL